MLEVLRKLLSLLYILKCTSLIKTFFFNNLTPPPIIPLQYLKLASLAAAPLVDCLRFNGDELIIITKKSITGRKKKDRKREGKEQEKHIHAYNGERINIGWLTFVYVCFCFLLFCLFHLGGGGYTLSEINRKERNQKRTYAKKANQPTNQTRKTKTETK